MSGLSVESHYAGHREPGPGQALGDGSVIPRQQPIVEPIEGTDDPLQQPLVFPLFMCGMDELEAE
jgi:hypothetical protein